MTTKEMTQFIEECNKLGSVPGLASITELTKQLGNPQNFLRFIHIAGTNGKGSVLAYISTVLSEYGLKVGRYISPTIFEYRERFQINGTMIGQNKLNQYMEQVKEACDIMVSNGMTHPTSFEIETAVAFLYFKDQKCDIVVLETGMGGLLDATNIVTTTIMSVITSVSMDHTAFLGNTLSEIATHKAGIIKKNTVVVAKEQCDDVMKVITDTCNQKEATLSIVDTKKVSHVHAGLFRQTFQLERETYAVTLAGNYQIENAVVAITALKTLFTNQLIKKKGKILSFQPEMIKKGLEKTIWRGRFTVVNKKPLFIVDGAHNEDASKRLAESIDNYFTNKRKIYIMGMFKDKECEKVIQNTVSKAEQIITITTPHNVRAMPAYELGQIVKQYNPNVTVADSLEEAVEMSLLFAQKEGVVIAFGSLSYLGELMTIVEKHKVVRSDTHGK